MKTAFVTAFAIVSAFFFMQTGCGFPSTSPADDSNVISGGNTNGSGTTNNNDSSGGSNSSGSSSTTNAGNHEDPGDYEWNDSDVVNITLNGGSIAIDGTGAAANGSKATITAEGTYNISGSLTNGQIVVDSSDDGTVRLILDGATIRSSTNAAIYVAGADKVVIVLADGTQNYVSDGSSRPASSSTEDEPTAAIFSMSDLTIFGDGALTVHGNYEDGITSKDGLIIASGTLTVEAYDDGIRGKDYLIVENGQIEISAEGDGMKSDNEDDATRGYVTIEDGEFEIVAGGDAIAAATDASILGGNFKLIAGGGSNAYVSSSESAKGVKAGVDLTIEGGTFAINSADDAIHSNGTLLITGGTFDIATGDDGIHAEEDLDIDGGDIDITECYEGVESSTVLTINGGRIRITADDDGLNVAGGVDGSGWPGGPGQGGPGQGGAANSGNCYLYINGGYIAVDALGDGIDVNGSAVMTGGTVLVHGPTANDNGALDHASFKITGGTLIAAGSAGMAQAPGTSSSQRSVMVNYRSTQQAGTLVHVQTSSGVKLFTFAPSKRYQNIVFSSPALAQGTTYEVYSGGSSTGTPADGLYPSGAYTPGTRYTSFTVTGIVTTINR